MIPQTQREVRSQEGSVLYVPSIHYKTQIAGSQTQPGRPGGIVLRPRLVGQRENLARVVRPPTHQMTCRISGRGISAKPDRDGSGVIATDADVLIRDDMGEVVPESWTGRIVNPESAIRSLCPRNDVSTVPI